MNKKWVTLLISCLALCAFKIATKQLFEVPLNWPKPRYDFKKNPLTKQKVELGRELFYDPILSKNNLICSGISSNSLNSTRNNNKKICFNINMFGTDRKKMAGVMLRRGRGKSRT